jgi:putative ABC transport system permease protein
MREGWSKLLRALHLRRDLDRDLSEEMQTHLDLITADHLDRGMSADEARAAARRSFGNLTRTHENAREAWQFPRLETVLRDIRYGLRGIRKAPGFSFLVILTLALGIGANTAIFSVVYSVLLRPLPYPHSERLVWLGESTGKAAGISITWINFQHWRSENNAFEDMALFAGEDFTLTGHGDALITHAQEVTSGFFALTGGKPLLGRLFTPDDDKTAAAPTVVLTANFWQSVLGADPQVVGKSLDLNGKSCQVIGVLQPGFKFLFGFPDLYLPLGRTAVAATKRSEHGSLRGLGLLKSGESLSAARANLDSIMQRLALSDPGPEDDHRAFVDFLTETSTAGVRPVLLILMGAVGLVLLIACANVASLLLVRSTTRAREMAVRVALGAGRPRLARQLLTENLLIASLGGVLGVLLAAWCLRVLVLTGPLDIPRLSEARINIPVLLFAAAISVSVGLVAGLPPIFAAGKLDLTIALKEGSPASSAARTSQSFRNLFVVAEIAVTLILAFASALLLRSLMAAETADPGCDPHHLLVVELQLPETRYSSDESVRQYFSQLLQRLRAEPGVQDAGLVSTVPGGGDNGDYWYSILEKPVPGRSDVPLSLFDRADATYFRASRIRLLAGRTFSDADRPGGTPVAIINEELSRQWWNDPRLAIGQHLKVGGPYVDGPTLEIVGVVANVSQIGLDSEAWPTFYYAFSQRPSSAMLVTLRTSGDPAQWMNAVRHDVFSIDRNIPIDSLRTAEDWLGATLDRRRFATLLLGLFGGLAMLLASVGIYGVLNYWVSARQKEIAIRLAMGAPRSAIFRWTGLHVGRLATLGIVLGAVGAYAASFWLKSLVFGVSAGSPLMMLFAGAIVIAIAALAAALPVYRAMHTDPVRNLHQA